MKIIKKFTAIRIVAINDENKGITYPQMLHGFVEGPYYSRKYPETEFATEEEAIEHAYKTDKFQNWLIVPIISFDNSDEEQY